jgi:hypothetical protein
MLNALLDKLQATFPPNRIVVLLTPLLFIPGSAAVTAWVAIHFPGLAIPEGLIVGLSGAAALGALTLAYKWLDQWQKGEPISIHPDIEAALAEAVDSPDVHDLFSVLGSLEGVGQALGDLRTRLDSHEQIPNEELSAALAPIIDHTAAVVHQHQAVHPAINTAATPEVQ